MTYTKPKGITYTQMAITIDEIAYKDDCDEELLFQYLYHLSVMLAYKAKYFKNTKYYDDFGLFMASSAYFRLRNPKQFIVDEVGNPKMTKIKSILNYLKTILYPRKVAFEQENYAQVDTKIDYDSTSIYPGYTFANKLSDTADLISKVEFECVLNDIDKSIRSYLKNIPYKYESNDWYNIYISVMLSFLNSFVLSNNDRAKLLELKYKVNDHYKLVEAYENNSYDYVILFHLPYNMRSYIHILVKLIKKTISQDLSFTLHTEVNSSRLSFPILQQELNNLYEV